MFKEISFSFPSVTGLNVALMDDPRLPCITFLISSFLDPTVAPQIIARVDADLSNEFDFDAKDEHPLNRLVRQLMAYGATLPDEEVGNDEDANPQLTGSLGFVVNQSDRELSVIEYHSEKAMIFLPTQVDPSDALYGRVNYPDWFRIEYSEPCILTEVLADGSWSLKFLPSKIHQPLPDSEHQIFIDYLASLGIALQSSERQESRFESPSLAFLATVTP